MLLRYRLFSYALQLDKLGANLIWTQGMRHYIQRLYEQYLPFYVLVTLVFIIYIKKTNFI